MGHGIKSQPRTNRHGWEARNGFSFRADYLLQGENPPQRTRGFFNNLLAVTGFYRDRLLHALGDQIFHVEHIRLEDVVVQPVLQEIHDGHRQHGFSAGEIVQHVGGLFRQIVVFLILKNAPRSPDWGCYFFP
jgi:hypothetical protein